MCQDEYNPELVIAIEGDRSFTEIAIEIMEIHSTEGGKNAILEYINNLGGFNFEHICTDIEGNIRLFIGLQCPWCSDTFDVSGFYSLEIERGYKLGVFMNEFERVHKFRPESYLNAALSLLIFEILKEYMSKMNENYMRNFFEEEIEYYDDEGDELSSVGKLPDNYDLEADISSAFEELNKGEDEDYIDPNDICQN
jgi:hypothetical protein